VAYERITINPNRMTGLPCIRDTRVTVSAVLGQLAAERSIEEVLVDYPYLERADILAALEFAAAAVQERELPLAQPACATGGAGGARTHDRRIMRSPARRCRRSTCTDTTQACHRWP
jgi:uncharacterized protein (DUF433 family)